MYLFLVKPLVASDPIIEHPFSN